MKLTVQWLCIFVFVGLLPAAAMAQVQASATKPAGGQSAHSTATHPSKAHSRIDPALLHPALLRAKAPAVYEVTFATTKGDFVVQVTRAWAPLGADRFYNLVRHHFFDGVSFFRVVQGFVVQFGLTGNPAVNKAWEKATIKDDPVTQSNKLGAITFATAGPNTRTTQVFINLGSNAGLDAQGFAPFGTVISGVDVVQNLYGAYGDAPTARQDEITKEGKAFLDKNFPKLDSIKAATVTSPAPATPRRPAQAAKKPAIPGSTAPKP